ncbi:MAG: hypothetical protein LBE31_02130 [Deltaproteobacteria bacterium]|nr:hypothetical protein [Deltaproteobacteria bacterium]
MCNDLLFEFVEPTPPPTETAKNASSIKQRYLVIELESRNLGDRAFVKYLRYTSTFAHHLQREMDKNRLKSNSDSKNQPGKGRPIIRLLIVAGLGINKVALDKPEYCFRTNFDIFFTKDIDPQKTFLEIQALVDSNTPLSFMDRFKLLVLPISGGVSKINPKFAAECFRLIYKAYGRKDVPAEVKKIGMALADSFVLLYNRELNSELWTTFLEEDNMVFMSEAKYFEGFDAANAAAEEAKAEAEKAIAEAEKAIAAAALKFRDFGMKPSEICQILNISKKKLGVIFKNSPAPSTEN